MWMILPLVVLLTSGCESKIQYLPCPQFEPLTEPPILDMNKIGKIKKISKTHWEVTDVALKEQIRFNKTCKQSDADHRSTLKAINTFNKNLVYLNE